MDESAISTYIGEGLSSNEMLELSTDMAVKKRILLLIAGLDMAIIDTTAEYCYRIDRALHEELHIRMLPETKQKCEEILSAMKKTFDEPTDKFGNAYPEDADERSNQIHKFSLVLREEAERQLKLQGG